MSWLAYPFRAAQPLDHFGEWRVAPSDGVRRAMRCYGGAGLTLTSSGDSYQSNEVTPDCGCGLSYSGSTSVGGTWTEAPEIDPASTTTAVTLLLGGLMVFVHRRRPPNKT